MNRLHNGTESDTSHSGWYDEMGATADQLFVVSTYTDFERLGEEARRTLSTRESSYCRSSCTLPYFSTLAEYSNADSSPSLFYFSC